MARNKNINKIIGDGFVELQKEVIALRAERDALQQALNLQECLRKGEAKTIDRVTKERDALQAWKDEAEKQEPVAAVRIWDEFSINTFEFEQYAGFRNLPVGEYKLYLNPAPAKEGYVLISEKLVLFLNGESPLEGKWFGEMNHSEAGKFWWRKYLPEAQKEE